MSEGREAPQPGGRRSYKGYQTAGLFIGPLAFLALILLPRPEGLTQEAWATAALAVWMAVWWATEALPLAATALLPLVLLPALGVSRVGGAAAPYANPLIFLFLGGFLIALAMQRWNLHRRIALHVVVRAAGRPGRLVAGVMLATAGLSMWISNTATAMMMLPIALSLIAVVDWGEGESAERDADNFAAALLLGIAYSASIGGLGTLVGSPPNALLASFLYQSYGLELSFAAWMAVGLPVVILLLPLAWLVLTRLAHPFSDRRQAEGAESLRAALAALGPMTSPERRVAAVFGLVALAWLANPLFSAWLGPDVISDPGIAIAGALLLFALPADWKRREFLLNWEWARRVPWEILILFGGGLSLAKAIDETGLAAWLGGGLSLLAGYPTILLIAGVALLVIFLTELTSNTATTAAFLPVVAALALATDLAPLMLTLPAALAASCAFMLPVATPPNAIVFGSGRVTVPQMIRAGVLLNLAGVVVITAAVELLLPLL